MPPVPSQLPTVRTITVDQTLTWLGQGWRDARRAGAVSFAHGLAMAIIGAVIIGVTYRHFWLLAGALSGFMVIAPVLATSLYALSRTLERNEVADTRVVLKTWLNWQNSHINKWSNDYWCMFQFGALLALAATGWVVTSAALITLLAPVPILGPQDFIEHVVLAKSGHLFELWMTVGGILAAPMFASSAITMPLLLDRRIALLPAVLTSWQAVLANPVPMGLWAATIMVLTLLGLSALLLGLVLVIPVLGHASWHAYRDLIDASSLPLRETLSTPPKTQDAH